MCYHNVIFKILKKNLFSFLFFVLVLFAFQAKSAAQMVVNVSSFTGLQRSTNVDVNSDFEKGIERANAMQLLSETSHYFLSNVIRSASAGNENKELYDKLLSKLDNKSDVWIQALGGYANYKEDDNSVWEYRDNSYGIMVGAGGYFAKNFKGGIFAKYTKNDITQGDNSAEVDNLGGGLYGGYMGELWEIKFIFSSMQNRYNTTRHVADNSGRNTLSADFAGISIGTDLEIGYVLFSSNRMKITPFTGIEMRQSEYKSFEESGNSSLNVKVNDTSYNRTLGKLGVKIRYEYFGWSWYIDGQLMNLFEGNTPDIDASFVGTTQYFNTKGFKEKSFITGIGGGVAFDITKTLKFYCDLNYYNSENYDNVRGNIGVKWHFGVEGDNVNVIKQQKKDNERIVEGRGAIASEEPTFVRNDVVNELADSRFENKVESSSKEPIFNISEEPVFVKNDVVDEPADSRFESKVESSGKEPIFNALDSYVESRGVGSKEQITLGTGYFEKDGYSLTNEAIMLLDRVIINARIKEFKKMIIEGHTDSADIESLDNELALKRSLMVFGHLRSRGIPLEKLEYWDCGTRYPMVSSDTKEGRDLNRRVEIFIVK